MRVAGAIVLDTLAFSIWNIGTRSPAHVLRDMREHGRDSRAVLTGAFRALIGLIFVTASTVLLLPAVVYPPADFAPTEIFALVVAVALEHVVGADVRAFVGPVRKST